MDMLLALLFITLVRVPVTSKADDPGQNQHSGRLRFAAFPCTNVQSYNLHDCLYVDLPLFLFCVEIKLMLLACDGQGQNLCFVLTLNSSIEDLEDRLSFQFRVNNGPIATLQLATGDEQASISGNTTAGYVIQFASSRRVCLQAQLMLINSGPFSSNTRCLSPVRGQCEFIFVCIYLRPDTVYTGVQYQLVVRRISSTKAYLL